MLTRLKRKSALLMLPLLLMLWGCSSQPLVPPMSVRIPPPPADLMTPATGSSVNVPILFGRWTRMLEDWQAKLQACKDTPQECV